MDQNTAYSSNAHTSGSATEWVALNLGSVQQVNRLLVTPRVSGYGFPVNFSLQSSTDGTNWSTISGQSYTNYANPGSSQQSFTFSSPATAQYIRILATQLGADQYGTYYLQIAQMAAQNSLAFTATASTQITGWAASNVADGLASTVWSSTGHSSASSTEWLQLDLGSTSLVQDLRVVPRDGYCFPQSFTITYSTDGSTWTQVPGQAYDSYASPALAATTPNPVQLFDFSSLVSARYIRITAMVLRADNYGNYYFQVADVFVDQ